MKNQKMIITIILTAIFSVLWADDYFPVQTGNKWKFTFDEYNGHGSGGTTKKGNISWTILSHTMIDPGSGKSIVKVLQQSDLCEKSYHYYNHVDDYDSIFNPPRSTMDTIILIDSANVCMDTANSRILIHDPQGPVPDKYCIIDTTIKIDENEIKCVIPIDTPCDLSSDGISESVKHSEFNFFYQTGSKGPVKYTFDSHGTRQITGTYHRIEWLLQETANYKIIKKINFKSHCSSEKSYYTITGKKLNNNALQYSGICIQRIDDVQSVFQKILLLH